MPATSMPQQAAGPQSLQERLDQITRAAQRLSGAPAAFICLNEGGRQRCASRQGLAAAGCGSCPGLCGHPQRGAAPLIVEDVAADTRFADLPPVAGAQARFYAGWPLRDCSGRSIGTLGILDHIARAAHAVDRDTMRDLALWAEAELGKHALQQGLAEARESASRLHAVLDHSAEGIVTLDQRGIITSINRTAVRMFGYQPEEVAGKSINILMPQKYHEAHDGHLHNFRDTGRTHVIGIDREVAGRRKDGTVFSMAITVNEMWLDGERGFSGIVRDLSEHRENKRRLHETSALLQAVMSSTSSFVYVRDLSGHFLYVNKEYERVFGVTSAQVLGKRLDDVFPPGMAQHNRDMDRAVLDGGISSQLEDELQLEDGRHTFLVVRRPLVSEKGEVYGVCGVGTDITARKQAEHFKNEFISTVSHELRTPLTSIRGSLGLLSGGVAGNLPQSAQSLLDIANSNCERLVRLINDILDIEKIESGHMRFEFATQRMMPLVEQALAATRDYAAQYQVAFEVQGGAEDAFVTVDTDRMVQVVVNLLSNAAKFSPPGSRVQLRLAQRPGMLRLSVIDRGRGIPAEFRQRIFGRFAQADCSDMRKKGGTGLGLSISRAIVERHRGRIDFDSTPGKGSEFHVDLPLAAAPGPAAPAHGRVLVCEDDPDIARLLGMMLAQAGLGSDIAHDAAQARSLLMQGRYDAMTLDLSLPRENGVSLLRWMRAQEALRSLPVVVVSARAEDGRRALSGSAVGIIDWIGKPIDEARLLAALRSAMQRSREQAPRVLYVEGDRNLVQAVRTLLAPAFMLIHAAGMAEAREKLAADAYSAILLDLQLPDGHGAELLNTLPPLNAATPVVVFSAEDTDRNTADSVHAVLVKSRTSNEELMATLQALILPAPKDQR